MPACPAPVLIMNHFSAMRVAWVVVLLAGWAAAQSPTPWTGTRDGRNLECNSTADGAVLLNGNDVVSRTAWPVALSQNPRGTRVFYLVSIAFFYPDNTPEENEGLRQGALHGLVEGA